VSYAIDPDLPAGEELARVIARQHQRLREAAATLDDADAEERAIFVHRARVRIKKIRAALRLGRRLMGEKAFRRENRWWRDTARGLSGLRDMTARLDALEAMRRFLEPELGRSATIRLHAAFERQRAAAELSPSNQGALATFRDRVLSREAATDGLFDPGEAEDVARALAEGYRAAREAMKLADHVRTPEALHEWRKRAKAHALQLRLARRLFPDAIDDRLEPVRDFAETLGGLQDIEVLRRALIEGREERVLEALESRRAVLAESAMETGRALFAMKRKAWAARLEAPLATREVRTADSETELAR
jgi:CHAD domain-containing protein